jgi:hypothetical protein
MYLETKLPKRLYISSESHYYLEKVYKLKVIKSTENFIWLCHLRYWDHSKKFQNLLRVLMPDFEKQKAKLDECVN